MHGLPASAYGLNWETERAAGELVEAQRLTGDDHFFGIARLKAFGKTRGYHRAPTVDFEGTYFAGLRKAGMPEE